ncbi:Golgi to ER traffic protein 1 [Nakaseomyces bracarensis]|uniref:Golgi to ER traffic protein 1 n=1 Tax=Nakaseomyces bracarensis TaxID=273131 RepID=A0ABR4NZQ1_9SACH
MASWVIFVAVFYFILIKLVHLSQPFHDAWLESVFFKRHPVTVKFHELIKERRKVREENKSLSAQDHYAKWTKNNRKLDKLDKEIDELAGQIKANNEKVKGSLKKLKLVLITVPFLLFKLWKGKHIVYNLPDHQMFPQLIAGVWSQGWLYIALLPLQLVKQTLSGSTVDIETATIPHLGVSLGIWLWALERVSSTIEFMIKQFGSRSIQKPITENLEIKSDEIKMD